MIKFDSYGLNLAFGFTCTDDVKDSIFILKLAI